jgi:hypothetical protein
MRESRLYGSVRGALSNERPYRVPYWRAFFCCDCSRRLMALFVKSPQCTNSEAIGGTADRPRTHLADWSGANDPKRSKAGAKFRTAASP